MDIPISFSNYEELHNKAHEIAIQLMSIPEAHMRNMAIEQLKRTNRDLYANVFIEMLKTVHPGNY